MSPVNLQPVHGALYLPQCLLNIGTTEPCNPERKLVKIKDGCMNYFDVYSLKKKWKKEDVEKRESS